MTTVLCTLYNSLYIDKGLVLYDSLCNCAKDFKLYVLCMDDKCYDVLTDLKQEYHIPVRLADFEAGDTDLLDAKGNRSMGEYCWTCSSSFIRYILKHFGEESCTYIDADMYFYQDPHVLIDEMMNVGKSVMIIPHWFHEGNKKTAEIVGKYCVEFNTFLNKDNSLEVLDYWRKRCLELCSNLADGVHWGDQKYLEELESKFDSVYVCTNKGAGLAPWNMSQYRFYDETTILDCFGKRIEIVFFHYQGVAFLDEKYVDIGYTGSIEKGFYNLYYNYLTRLKMKKDELIKMGINTYFNAHPGVKSKYNVMKRLAIGGFLFKWKRILIDRDKIIIKLS